jgi:hypothetical protein
MVEIRVLGKNHKEVEAWFRLVLGLVDEQAGGQGVYCQNVSEGRKGDYLGYVRIGGTIPLVGEIAAPRVPRKGRLSAGRRRRANG